jgi:hypothetical protein
VGGLDVIRAAIASSAPEVFDVIDRIAGAEWDGEESAALLARLASAMADEVEVLASLDPDGAGISGP